MKKKYYITTAIAYASRKPHFGNTYEAIMTDAIARYKRSRGFDVFFCTGTDEHGQKIENLAKESGISPQQYVDNVSGEVKTLWDKMNTSYDYFIRTTDEAHMNTVSKIFKRFYDQGDIYKGFYEDWYCTPCEAFFTETQLIDGKCPDCGRPVEMAREETYYFKMSKYADKLMQYIEEHPDFIEPESRKKEMVNNFLKAGLQDLCVSRTSFKWGVPTFDENHVIYVWLDALSNYITAIGYDPDKSYEEQSEQFKKYWPADVHIIGKDILRFHTIYWPIFLMALDLPLPKKVFGHPWFNFGLDKMSKSKGNVIYADQLADKFGVDGVRYYALAEMPYAGDGSITYENVINRFNSDLVNNLGNLVKRTLDMSKKYFEREILPPVCKEAVDDDLFSFADKAFADYCSSMDDYHIADAIDSVFALLRRANKYIDETTPWTLAKDASNRERLGTVLYNLLEIIRRSALMLQPIIPDTALEILNEIGASAELEYIKQCRDNGKHIELPFDDFYCNALKPGTFVNDSTVLFARINEQKMLEEIQAEYAALNDKSNEKTIDKPTPCALIDIDGFMNVELRTAKITECERIPHAKKLLKLKVDLGYEQRQVVSGIANFYKPEELIGKIIIIVANLKPAVLCGTESNGMILASGEKQIRVVFLSDDTPLGERVR